MVLNWASSLLALQIKQHNINPPHHCVAVLSELWFRRTDPGCELRWIRRDETGGDRLQHSESPHRRPDLHPATLHQHPRDQHPSNQLAPRRLGTGEWRTWETQDNTHCTHVTSLGLNRRGISWCFCIKQLNLKSVVNVKCKTKTINDLRW